jgi:nucleoside-diphosphate-sugar epimerase
MTKRQDKPLILVTGATGYLGTRIAREFAPNATVIGLDLEEPGSDWPGEEWIHCDLTSEPSAADALAEVKTRFGDHIRSVIHLAAYYDFSGDPSPLYDQLTVEGSRRLMRLLHEGQLTVEQFVFSSSLLVMEPKEQDETINETSPTKAEWDYPRSKLEAEAALREERGDIPLAILRIAGVYDDGCHSIPLAQHIRRIYEKDFRSYFFPGDPDHGSPYLHLDDLAACMRQVVAKRADLDPDETFLVAEPEILSYLDLQDRIGNLVHGTEWPTLRVPASVAKAGAWVEEKMRDDVFIKPWMVDLADDHYPVSIRRANDRLEWQPERRLSKTLPAMVEELLEDPKAWYEANGLPLPEEIESGKS